jgi:hypothetical protein
MPFGVFRTRESSDKLATSGGNKLSEGKIMWAKATLIITAVLVTATSSTSWAQTRERERSQRPMDQRSGGLGNDSCDKQVRAKYPSGTLGANARLRMVEACRMGRTW